MEKDKIKHLEFIQNAINRMNTNSFQLKGWMITIVSALIAIYVSNRNVYFVFTAILPVLLFWFLDAYYLQQERKLRGIYDDVANLSSENDKKEVKLFEMPLKKYTGGKYCFFNVFKSKTIAPLYGIMSLILLIGGLILSCCKTFKCH